MFGQSCSLAFSSAVETVVVGIILKIHSNISLQNTSALSMLYLLHATNISLQCGMKYMPYESAGFSLLMI